MSLIIVDGLQKKYKLETPELFSQTISLDIEVFLLIREMENISIHVASGKVDNFLLKDIIQSIIYEDDFSEELKLQLIDAII